MKLYFDTKGRPWLVWVGFALIGISLALLPFALAQVGTTWVRITNYAILYVMLALAYSVVIPLFEGPDEVANFEHVRFLAQQHTLPSESRPGYPGYVQSAGHPPLYYALGAVLAGRGAGNW